MITDKKLTAALLAAGLALGCMPAHAEGVSVNALVESISQSVMTLKAGETKKLTVDNVKSWTSSDVTVAQVDNVGNITAISNGKAVITAYLNDGSKQTCDVTVATPVTKVTLPYEKLNMDKGDSFSITARMEPNNASETELTWTSSDPSVVSVDKKTGLMAALKTGTAKVTAAAPSGASASVDINVTTPADSVKLNSEGISFTLDSHGNATSPAKKLTAAVYPDDADDKGVKWSSSDTSVATVDSDGLVTPKGEGVALITAETANGLSASCTATVASKTYPVTGLTLTKTSDTGYIGSNDMLDVKSVTPDYASDKTVTWTSSDPSVASVDGFGDVRFLKAGTAVITAKSVDGPSASCTYTVTAKKAENVDIMGAATVLKGKKSVYKAVVSPDDATYQGVAFKTSNKKIATISKGGVLTAKKGGTVTVTAYSVHDPSVKSDMLVTVRVIYPTKVKAVRSKITLRRKKTKTLASTVKFTPSNTTERSIKWRTSNRKVVKISGAKMKGLRKGKATVTGTVKVLKKAKVQTFKADKTIKYIMVNKTIKYRVTVK